MVTALFCDLVDSTVLGGRTDPEELDPMLRSYYALAREAVERRGGVVEKFIGDAIAALFGYPVAHEDDPRRAVRAALEIVEQVQTAGLGLRVRIAVETGEAFVRANVAAGGHGFATGDVLNTTSRLQSAAAPMSVIVGSRAAGSLGTGFELSELAPLRLKGKDEPVRAWRVLGAVPAAAEARQAGPLVGRERELEALRAAVRAVASGAGGVILVEGDPGIGKSRLVREVRESSGVLWLRGRSVETKDAAGYRPFAEQIRAWVGRPAGWDELVWRSLSLGLGREHARFLAAIAEIEPDPETAERLAQLDPEALRPSVYRSVRAWLAALSASRPLVLEFEDWHWADGASGQLLEHVLPLVRDSPLLIVVASRAEAVDGPFAAAGARRVPLSPLADEEARLLLGELVADRAVTPDRLVGALARAEGNPYFLHELSRFLAEGTESADLPDNVRAVVISRVDRLPPELGALLRSASVIGRSFAADLLSQVAEAHEVAAPLDELAATRLIERVEAGRYAFAHALTREAVYEAVPLAERRRLHRRAADALMEDPSDAGSLPSIAYHLARAEDWEAAAAALVAAGEHAARLASDDEALEMYRAAIEAHERLPADLWSPLERSRIDREVADALRRLGRHGEASRQIVAALARLGVRLPAEKAAIRRAALRQLLPRLLGPPRLPPPDAAPDPVQLEIDRELEVLGWIAYFEDFDTVALVDLTLANRAARARDLEGLGVGTFRGALAFLALGRERLAWRYTTRALEAAERITDPVQVARIKQGLAVVPLALSGWEETRALAEPAMNLCAEAGDLRIWGASAAILLTAAGHHGDLARARELAVEVERAGAEGGNVQVHGWGLLFLSFVNMLEGDAEAAVRFGEASVEELLRVPDHLVAVTGLGCLARAQLRAGDAEAAAATIERARLEREARGFAAVFVAYEFEARAELALLRLARDRNRQTEAGSRRANRESLSRKHLARWHTLHAHVLDGGTFWLLGDRRRALRAFERARRLAAEYEWHGTLAEATRWVSHCCAEAGVEPPPLPVEASAVTAGRAAT